VTWHHRALHLRSSSRVPPIIIRFCPSLSRLPTTHCFLTAVTPLPSAFSLLLVNIWQLAMQLTLVEFEHLNFNQTVTTMLTCHYHCLFLCRCCHCHCHHLPCPFVIAALPLLCLCSVITVTVVLDPGYCST
jgi:hypothetical protein